MGEVYRARDPELERDVALKVLPTQLAQDSVAMERFRREAVLLASVHHPHIATLFGLEEEAGIRFLVLELVEGRTLGKVLEGSGLSVVEAIRVGSQIAKALEAAHKRGIIHRDLKPANVMVGGDGWVKVLDFGVAKALAAHEPELTTTVHQLSGAGVEVAGDLTAAGTVVGTPAYISPEQLRDQQVDNRSDIWAFGCLLYECLSGVKAFEAKTTRDTFENILHGSPDWEALPAQTPPAVRTLLGRCLQKEPDRRLHSISDARIELDDVLHPMLAPQQPPGGGAEPAPPSTTSPPTFGYLSRVGPYSVVERLGAGATAEVYRAWDRRKGCDVALKVLRPGVLDEEESVAQLCDESDALRTLRHPNIAGWYDSGSAEELDYLVMEYVAGESLASKLEAGPLPEPEVARLGSQIASALAEAHRKDLLHGDLKAGNVMVTPEGQAKVIDFGLAWCMCRETDAVTQPSELRADRGPLVYMAPEVLAGEEPTAKSDLYSLGVLLYQMATGKRPFPEEDVQELTEAILRHPPGKPSALRSSLSAELDRIIQSCLEKEPARRPSSAAELSRLLAAQIPPPAATSITAIEDQAAAERKRRKRRRNLIAAGAVFVVALAALWAMAGGSLFETKGLAGIDSLVVMPTRLLGEETAAYLTDAIPNSLSAHLSRVEDLETKVPPSSVDTDKVGGDLVKVAEAYDVSAMILSTVSSQGTQMVLNVQLAEAAGNKLLWSQEYRGRFEEYPVLVQQAAEEIRQALRPGADSLAASSRQEENAEAEIAMQQGLYYSNLFRNRGRAGDKERAIEAFSRALKLDPERADAAAEIAVVHSASVASGVSMLEVLPEIRYWVDRALKADPHSSRAWTVRGEIEGGHTIESFHRKLEFALKAASYGPRDGYAHSRLTGPLAVFSPRLALEAARQASRVEPLVVTSPLFESLVLIGFSRWDEAKARVDYALDIEPESPFGLITEAIVLSQFEEEEALRIIDEKLEPLVEKGQMVPLWIDLPRTFAKFGIATREGDRVAADEAARRLDSMARGETPFLRWQISTNAVAAHLARFGRPGMALDLLEFRAQEEMLPPYEHLLLNPYLSTIRGRPRFTPLLTDGRRRFMKTLAVLEESRNRGELPPYLEEPLADLLALVREAQQALASP